MISVILVICILITLVYALTLVNWLLAWRGNARLINRMSNTSQDKKVSIIIAVRNEQDNMVSLFDSLNRLEYPEHLVEICISDDFSEDNTRTIVKQIAPACRFPVKLVEGKQGEPQGKKAALERAIRQSSGELIFTTDADCNHNPGWLRSVTDFQNTTNAHMVTGMVRLSPCGNLFEKLQGLEFLSLTGSGAVSVIDDNPIMCNGANLAFTRSAFMDAGGYDYGNNTASGDDTFLMLKIHRMKPGSVFFIQDRGSIVTTKPLQTFNSLFRQRLRWISKTHYYKERRIAVKGYFMAFAHLVPLIVLIILAFDICPFWFALSLWAIKFFPEWLFLRDITGFTGDRKLLCLFLPAAILYPIYVIVGLASAIVSRSYEWKGRTYRV